MEEEVVDVHYQHAAIVVVGRDAIFCHDVVYNSMRMWQGAVDSSLHDGIVSPAYVVVRPVSMTASRFFARLLKRPNLLCQAKRSR